MNSREYEQLLSQITQSIYELVEGITGENVAFGRTNRWQGASGYKHQIDVSVCGPTDLILGECKYWRRNISVESVLAFYGRVQDISSMFHGKVHGIIATTTGFQPGAVKVATHFEIDLRLVQSVHEFAIAYKDHMLLGVRDFIHFSDKVDVVSRRCSICGSDLILDLGEQKFKCPQGH